MPSRLGEQEIGKGSLRASRPRGSEKLELLVDTGSVYSWIPERVLEKVGASRAETITFTTIEGRRVRRPVGEAKVEFDGTTRHCVVVFGKPGDASVLGVTALENLALEVDPATKRLRRSKALAAY